MSHQIIENFCDFFSEELLEGVISNTPKFKVIINGGYGLNVLLKTKYKNKSIQTNDIDLAISTHKCSMTWQKCLDYWVSKLNKFVQSQEQPYSYTITVINTGKVPIPIFDYNRYAIVSLHYSQYDIADLIFTDQHIPKLMYDRKTSLISKLPIKTMTYYLDELFTMIYMENVSDIYPYLYTKRNPFEGWYKHKGIQDIERANILCDLIKQSKYDKFCQLITKTSIDRIANSTKAERDEYFRELLLLIKRKKN